MYAVFFFNGCISILSNKSYYPLPFSDLKSFFFFSEKETIIYDVENNEKKKIEVQKRPWCSLHSWKYEFIVKE